MLIFIFVRYSIVNKGKKKSILTAFGGCIIIQYFLKQVMDCLLRLKEL